VDHVRWAARDQSRSTSWRNRSTAGSTWVGQSVGVPISIAISPQVKLLCLPVVSQPFRASCVSVWLSWTHVRLFAERALNMGFENEHVERIKVKSWATLGRFAYCVPYTPGDKDETGLTKLGVIINGAPADDPPDDLMPLVRRLFYEAFTLASQGLRSQRRDPQAVGASREDPEEYGAEWGALQE
jgi:hypothetical protein